MSLRVVGLVNQLIEAVIIGDVQGCSTNPTLCCDFETGTGSGSGSGSGTCNLSGCTYDCGICPNGMSRVWELHLALFGLPPVELCHVEQPVDGNGCRFVSGDNQWDLRFEYSASLWILTNLYTGHVWYTTQTAWQCQPATSNSMFPVDAGDSTVALTPSNLCSTWNCVSNQCVQVIGPGGTYQTYGACLAACGSGSGGGCFPAGPPATLPLTITGGAACINGTYTANLTSVVAGTYTYIVTNTNPCNPADNPQITISCTSGVWSLVTQTGSPPVCFQIVTPFAPTGQTPTSVVWTIPSLATALCGAGPFTFTLTIP
jgi:hypothetical protein